MNDVVERVARELLGIRAEVSSMPWSNKGRALHKARQSVLHRIDAISAVLADASPDIGKEGIGNDVR